MHRHDHPATACRPAGAATRRLVRRLLVAIAAGLLGLLPGLPGLAPVAPAIVRADEPDATTSPNGGLPGAVAPAVGGPTHDILDDAVVSSGAPDEQLDISAALDQGKRLFSVQARSQAGDYDLAGPQGVSSQPLRELFAP
ncbi:MAG: hypothetical protein JO057_24375, partial [Chloroflexi bacterium]|nr:hypothetical protein [Chloroflexota bacterium]